MNVSKILCICTAGGDQERHCLAMKSKCLCREPSMVLELRLYKLLGPNSRVDDFLLFSAVRDLLGNLGQRYKYFFFYFLFLLTFQLLELIQSFLSFGHQGSCSEPGALEGLPVSVLPKGCNYLVSALPALP